MFAIWVTCLLVGVTSTRAMEGDCFTISGVISGMKCIFPFRYNGVLHWRCTKQDHKKLWCSTKTDANDTYIDGHWGNCGLCGSALLQDKVSGQRGDMDSGYSNHPYKHLPVENENPLFANLKSAAIFGTLGIGTLGIAYFSHAIDQSCNKSLHAVEELHHNVDLRLTKVEKDMKNRGKEQKKLQIKANTLCKFANLLSDNPTLQVCNHGFNPGKAMKLMTPLMVAGSIGIGLAGNRGDDNTEAGVAEPENNPNGPW